MAGHRQILLYLLLIVKSEAVFGSASEETKADKEDLIETETRDGKLEIIKKIKKINDDGSYTIGYEADDGSFKIESRDVLGHIKGTYGFVDDDGTVKRVSYTSTNTSELLTKPVVIPTSSSIQRIPSRNRTTTKRPLLFSTSFSSTQATPTTPNSVLQTIAKRRTTLNTSTSSTTTAKPNYNEVVNISRSTSRPNTVTYTSAPPRVLLQGRPSPQVVALDNQTPKPERQQLMRPEIITIKPTELPLLKTLTLKRLEDEKPVHEEYDNEVRGNILRRQLTQRNDPNFNIREEIYRLQQAGGHDNSDVYSHSMTTGHPKPPLFTTTARPRISTTPVSANVVRPSVEYPIHFQRTPIHDIEPSPQYQRPVPVHSTSVPIPVAQIPANRAEGVEHLVAFGHPSQRGTILVPIDHLQGRIVPVEGEQRQYAYHQEPPPTRVVEIEQQKVVVRKLPPPPLRPIPVQVDENGYIRELPREVQTPYPLPVPVTPVPVPVHPEQLSKYIETDIENDIDNIQPPVSTRDFQKLLKQLILRQSRLEKISALTRQPDIYLQMQHRSRPVFVEDGPYIIQSVHNDQHILQRAPHQPIQRHQRKYVAMESRQIPSQIQQHNLYVDQYESQDYKPNRRVARLQPSKPQQQGGGRDEFLPPNVREMLLLRMLQLAINPALPLEENDVEFVSSASEKKGVRNVEILGEEDESTKRRIERSKMYKESESEEHY